MNENLAEMVSQETDEAPMSFPEDQLDIPVNASQQEDESDNSENETITQQEPPTIPVTNLGSWFEGNHGLFPNIKQVRLQVTGVDQAEDLVLTIPHESGEVLDGGAEKRRLMKIDDANVFPVVNLPGIDMNVYNNGFRIVSQYTNDIFLKCYGVKTGLIIVFCKRLNNHLLPYAKTKVGKKATALEFINPPEDFDARSQMALDKEALVLLYKQVSGDIENLSTNLDAVIALTRKQDSIRDINHHVQIDNALIAILTR